MKRFDGWTPEVVAQTQSRITAGMKLASSTETPKRANRHPEAAVQRAVIALLRIRGFMAIRYNSGGFKVGDTGYFRAYIVAGLNQSSGHPDVVGFRDGRCLFLEVKQPGGKLTDRQVRFHAWAKRHGVTVWTVESAAEVDAIIEREFA